MSGKKSSSLLIKVNQYALDQWFPGKNSNQNGKRWKAFVSKGNHCLTLSPYLKMA